MSFPILSGASLFPVARVPLAVMRVTNYSHERHGHDFQEVVLVVSGQAEQLRFEPGCDEPVRITISEGDVFWLPIGWSHSYSSAAPFEIYNILFDRAILGNWAEDTWPLLMADEKPATSSASLLDPLHLRRSERETLEGLLRIIMRELTLQKNGFELAARAKIVEVLVFLKRLSQEASSGAHALWDESGVIVQAISFLEEHFAEPIALRDMARRVHLSPNYFCEQFTLATGESPGRYLLRLRLEHARFLLLSTPISMTEVAHQSGFTDPSYFARAFKASFGVAPSRLRATGR